MDRVNFHKPKAQTLTVASCYNKEILEAQVSDLHRSRYEGGTVERPGPSQRPLQDWDLARYL